VVLISSIQEADEAGAPAFCLWVLVMWCEA
jgi:hypothetical protein